NSRLPRRRITWLTPVRCVSVGASRTVNEGRPKAMSCRKNTVSARALLVTSALLFGVCGASLHARGAPPATSGGREDIAELKKRVAKLEAEVAEMRKALRQAKGTPDSAPAMKKGREVAKL